MLNREATRLKDPYAELKITKAEDAYIQMLGELRHNPDTELLPDNVEEFYQANKKDIDKDKVDRAIEMARKTYDDLLKRVNEVLREQGMKEIPYRKGYFPHFTEDKQTWFTKLLNWKVNKNQIPTNIAGMTEMYQPERSWQRFNKQRMSDTTDYSFMKGKDETVEDKEQAVLSYINGLDAEYGEKIVLYVSEYSNKENRDTYGYEIIDYLNSRTDITYSEMERILTELGFLVDEDGYITWD